LHGTSRKITQHRKLSGVIKIEHLPKHNSSELPESSGELTQFATIKRYLDGDELIEKKDIQAAIQLAEFYLNWAKNILYP